MFTKYYALTNSEFGYLVNETLANFGYETIDKNNYKEIAASIWDYFIDTAESDVDGFIIVNKFDDWEEICNQKSLEYFIYREYKHIIEEEA